MASRDDVRPELSFLTISAIFACVGVTLEVVFTAMGGYLENGDLRLPGRSYVWMLPIYGIAPLLLQGLWPRVRRLPIAARLAIYVPLLFAIEFGSGFLLRKLTGECPWERYYRASPWSVDGLIRLDYAPAWAFACYLFERLYRALRVA